MLVIKVSRCCIKHADLEQTRRAAALEVETAREAAAAAEARAITAERDARYYKARAEKYAPKSNEGGHTASFVDRAPAPKGQAAVGGGRSLAAERAVPAGEEQIRGSGGPT